jgi:hypothetical protein
MPNVPFQQGIGRYAGTPCSPSRVVVDRRTSCCGGIQLLRHIAPGRDRQDFLLLSAITDRNRSKVPLDEAH